MRLKVLFLAMALLLVSGQAFAERSIYRGPKSYFSENKENEIQIDERTIVDSSCKAVFIKQGQKLWEKVLPSTPGRIQISNDGNSVVFVNWGWADEGYYKSVSFYDGRGKERKELRFGTGGRHLRQIGKSYLTADGKYFILEQSDSVIDFYDVLEAKLLWEKVLTPAYPLGDLQVSQSNGNILLCSYSRDGDAFFAYLDKDGNKVWEKNITKGYPIRKGLFGVVLYINEKNQKLIDLDPSGNRFSIYSLPESRWIKFENKDERVAEVN